MIAFVSDLHANLAATRAVFQDIDTLKGVERIICLGDAIGYGPSPVEVLKIVASRCKLMLMGNHEHALLFGPFGFHPSARMAIEWTREQIQEHEDHERLWGLIENLPNKHEINDVLLVHGSPRDPVMEYVLESDLWEGADPSKMEEIFEGFKHLCFVGHTHRPGVFTEDHCFLSAAELIQGYDVSDGKYLINVGSVGQPRDRDRRACYMLFTGDAVYWRRVEYDIDDTANRIREVEALGDRLANRLYKGE